MGKYFGTDGIRGIAYQELTEDFFRRAGSAIGIALQSTYRGLKLPYFNTPATIVPQPALLLGRDTRTSSASFAQAITEGVNAAGVSVIDLGVVPTPFVGLLANAYSAIGGVMITASHNPAEYNGIKVFRSDGLKAGSRAISLIEGLLDNGCSSSPARKRLGISKQVNALPLYIKHLRSIKELRGRETRIALDMAHGAASGLAEEVFSLFGYEIIPVCGKANGSRINAGCGATDTSRLMKKVKSSRADWGFAYDGDADRLAAVDGNGSEVNGDLLMALLVLAHKPYRESKKLVFTQMTNRGVELHLQANGIRTYRTDVGDYAVLEGMRRHGAIIGGEQSGHIICWDKTCGGDGILVSLLVSGLLVRENLSLSEFAARVPAHSQKLVNLKLGCLWKWQRDARFQKRLAALSSRHAEVRIYVRQSGTEKLIRILTEAVSPADALAANSEVAALFIEYDEKSRYGKEENYG